MRSALITLTVFLCGSLANGEEAAKLTYPKSRKVKQVDDFHGTKVADPYRWLEEDVRESKQVEEWVGAQNKITQRFLKTIPQRAAIAKRMTDLWNFEKFSSPFKEGGRYYYYHNSGLQNQYVLYRLDALDADPKVLIDPNKWSKDGTVALDGTDFSENGKYLAYGIQKSGSDWRTWKIMEIESGRILDDELKWVKFTSVVWDKKGKGLFYGRYPEPKKGEKFKGLNKNQKIYYHKLGTPQSEDKVVYERPDHPDWGFEPTVTDDGRYVVITAWKGTDDKYRISYKDLTKPKSKVVDLIDHFKNEYSFIGNSGSNFYFVTDLDAPLKRLIAIDVAKPNAGPREIIPQSQNTVQGISFVGGVFFARYLKDARSQVKIFSEEGKQLRELALPGIGVARGFGGKKDSTETFYSYSSFAVPPTVYRYDIATGKSTVYRQAKIKFDPADYVTKQVFYKSKDGTKVPMFITHKKGVKLNGKNPTLLYGYGGFSISLTPRFSVSRLTWMEMGGVYAQANLRGGGEYGDKWHRAGTKLRKQNVFDDFIAAAEWLIANKYTTAKKIAIQGGSNGGLLVGACMTQRPELFGACLPAVGVMDMLRFHKFTAGRFWVDDYGSADNAEEFKALHKYSPYHNLKKGTAYPATMVTTADTDDRVVPGHSFKFAARLQEYHRGENPVLIRIETKAGHGAGKPTAKIIEEIADMWGFLVKTLDMQLPDGF